MTNIDKEKLIEAILYQMPSITLHDKETGNETIVVEVETLTDFIFNFQFKPTKDAKEPKYCSQPNWEEMYKKEAAKNEELLHENERYMIQLERAWASLRTFEFVYGRKLNGIC